MPPGRPRLTTAAPHSAILSVRLPAHEFDAVCTAAKAARMTLSTYVRRQVVPVQRLGIIVTRK
jgi:hypothetical protein